MWRENCGSPTHRDDAMNRRCNSCEHLVRQCICPRPPKEGSVEICIDCNRLAEKCICPVEYVAPVRELSPGW